jgi:hypothetical protein
MIPKNGATTSRSYSYGTTLEAFSRFGAPCLFDCSLPRECAQAHRSKSPGASGMRVSGTEMGKRGRRIEITIQESRGFGVRALQGCVLAEKTLGALLFDHLSSAFGIPQEAYQAPHSANRPGNRNKSGIRAGTGLPDQRQAGCANCCGACSGISTAFQ